MNFTITEYTLILIEVFSVLSGTIILCIDQNLHYFYSKFAVDTLAPGFTDLA